jgi:membrane-associated phospholipid phosphatase
LGQLLTGRGLWPVDKVILAYFTFSTALIVACWPTLESGPEILASHAVLLGVLIYEIRRPNVTSWLFRNWYPVIYVGFCYREMALLIAAIWRGKDRDQWLANLDYRIWHVHPTIWLERIYSPALTEYLQLVYTCFIPAVLLVAFLLWKKRNFAEFQYYAFLIALGFLASYIGYLIVPARGPRFLLKHLQHAPLQGLWAFRNMQSALDTLESAHYDCFPSGHTELTILAWWSSRRVSNSVFRVYFAYTLSIIFATVYLRYHYTVDLLAGALLATALILLAPVLYKYLSKGGLAIGGR